MSSDHDTEVLSADGLCPRRRCGLPVGGVGERYGLCNNCGREERNRRLAQRDAALAAPPTRSITRGLTTPPVDRPLSAVVGARPTPSPIAPSKATEMAKESSMPRVFKLRHDADLHPELCRTDGCAGTPHIRGVCDGCRTTARGVGAYEAIAGPNRRGQKRTAVAVAKPPAGKAPLSEAEIATEIGNAEKRELTHLRRMDAEKTAAIENLHKRLAVLGNADTALRDELAAANDKLQVVVAHLNLDPAADLAKQVRDIAAWMQAGVDAARTLGATNPTELRQAANDAVQDTHLDALKKLQAECDASKKERAEWIDDAGASETELVRWRAGVWAVADRLEVPRGEPNVVPDLEILAAIDKLYADRAALNATIREQAAALASDEPVSDATTSRLYDVQQYNGLFFRNVLGYVDASGMFRDVSGGVIGSISVAYPKDYPELGEPVAGDAVWVRTKIREVTPTTIYTTDGGRYPLSDWTPTGFVRPATRMKIHD